MAASREEKEKKKKEKNIKNRSQTGGSIFKNLYLAK